MIYRINTMPVFFAGVSRRMKPQQFLLLWNSEMIPWSKVHGSLDSATAEPVLLARCPRGDLSARRESNFTGESATARAMRSLFQPHRAERSCYLSVTAQAHRARYARSR